MDVIKDQIQQIDKKIEELKQISLDNEELKTMAETDIKDLETEKGYLNDSLQSMQYSGPAGGKSTSLDDISNSDTCIIEIRAGTGGDEAGLFARELFEMYTRYAETKKWKVELISKNEGGLGNFKEVVVEISGRNPITPFKAFEYESGAHRVQRVPVTETGGRIHTSAATVAVLPIVKDIKIEIRPEDLRVDTFRAGGAGGQHVNKTESAIRITHLPTGLVVQCQDERSQHKNRERAMGILKSKIVDMMHRQQKESLDDIRSEQVGTGDRSEKIRTYNFPQDRVTDHRIKKSWFGLERIMAGQIENILNDTRDLIEHPEKQSDEETED